ncbi:MAG: DUF6876 family protein [Chloroflexota bacterium]
MSEKRAQLAAELEAELPHFTGTEEYHRIVYPWLRNTPFLLTDGAKHLADKAGVIGGTAYWLIDILASYQREKPVKDEPFQVWKLTVKESEGKITCDDGNGHILASQDIPFVDFAMDEATLYVSSDDYNGIIVMLPSEY